MGGKLRRVVEATFLKVRRAFPTDAKSSSQDASSPPPRWLILVQVKEEKSSGKVNHTRKLVSVRKFKHETWRQSARRCLMGDFCLTEGQIKELFRSAQDAAASTYKALDEFQESPSYPGIVSLYRTHLVSFEVCESYAISRQMLGFCPQADDQGGYSSEKGGIQADRPPLRAGTGEAGEAEASPSSVDTAKPFTTYPKSADGARSIDFEWMWEDSIPINVRGWGLWQKAKEQEQVHQVSSILIGLESAAPGCKSPFGQEHDAVGTSGKVSVVGGRKWRDFRTNRMPQVPADTGGMHVRITPQVFQQFRRTCEQIDFVDPIEDLIRPHGGALRRDQLDHRALEQEFFKRILGGNSAEARNTLEWLETIQRQRQTRSFMQKRPQNLIGPKTSVLTL